MKKAILQERLITLIALLYLLLPLNSLSQNDNCINASIINIAGNGYTLGNFNSTFNNISTSTIEPGENFAPAIAVAGQNQKSIWYKFSLPTTRSVRVTLSQSGSTISPGDVGFAIYKSSTCLPGINEISTKFTPLGLFGSTFHPCIEQGDYLIQVSAKTSANGIVYIQLQTDATNAAYDNGAQAYQFGTLTEHVKTVTYSVDCQSTEDITETCSLFGNNSAYNKSTWHIFKTTAYFDYIAFFLSHQNTLISQKFGYKLYKGDASLSPLSSLIPVHGCDSLEPTFSAARKFYKCGELDANSTYSIQLFFHRDFYDNVQVTLITGGNAPTQAPEPIISSIPATNKLGVLPSSQAGVSTTATDNLSCNSRHNLHACSPSLPAEGILFNGSRYSLSTFFTFTLSSVSNITISALESYCNTELLVQVYKQLPTENCNTLDTANIIYRGLASYNNLYCLEAGNYTLQILGRDTLFPASNYISSFGSFTNSNNPFCRLSGIGHALMLDINVKISNFSSDYSLYTAGAYDGLHSISGLMQPLVNNITYTSIDTFSCAKTVLPLDSLCSPGITKAIYREFVVADSGVVTLQNANPLVNDSYSKLYRGDANALATAQNVFAYPFQINGLVPNSACIQYNYSCEVEAKSCVIPGTYTYVSFGKETNVGQQNSSKVRFNIVNTQHNSPANAEDMGDILSSLPSSGGIVESGIDYFSCRDNAVPINGYLPCNIFGQQATKAIYRQFYLSREVNIEISGFNGCEFKDGQKTLFAGKATNGIGTLTALATQWQCFSTSSNGNCISIPAGWYTLVCYGTGPTYENQPLNNSGSNQSYVGFASKIKISITIPCPGPKYNRPYKAAIDSVTHQPFLIEWRPRSGSTLAYPRTDTTYTLYRENYNCVPDTPFNSHPIPGCGLQTKVTYYVFKTTQQSYLSIFTENYWAAVYPGDARTDSMSFASINPIQPCVQSYGKLQICMLQPGTYTLAVFASEANNCNSLAPKIYIDQIGYSRFDNAIDAYDFGIIPADSTYYTGKPGDINPLNPLRAPSNDYIYCTTGSRQSDPSGYICSNYNPNIYNTGVNNYLFQGSQVSSLGFIPRRNLWYTFVAEKGGTARVKVSGKTPGKDSLFKFTIYKSNVDGTLSFASVINTGQVDSTLNQGLQFITQNVTSGCLVQSNEASITRDPCYPVPTRYYIVVDNPSLFPNSTDGLHPNSQIEVSILFDSVNLVTPGDFCSNPVISTINGAATGTASVNIDCHTIGSDYGEYNDTLTCPPNALKRNYKTSWFRLDITGTDTLDVTTFLTENTTANPAQIKYRLMNGDCTAMQERSCVQDALTQDTYKCLLPGSYFIQVFVPMLSNGQPVTGNIELHFSAILHEDTCAATNSCLANAGFTTQFDCNSSNFVTFVNNSTFGTSIQYEWNFGYNGQTSSQVTPQFSYPVLPNDQTYTVTLTVFNSNCGGQNTFSSTITIPGRPFVELGRDSTVCNFNSPVLLNATYFPGTTYQWQDGSANSTFSANGPGLYWVKLNYNNCSMRDSIRIFESSVSRDTTHGFICPGQLYTLPWGMVVNNAGLYVDTTHYINGCDSIIRVVDLSLLVPETQMQNAFICEGMSYTLPWGAVVNNAGLYSDTLQSVAGCDSIIRNIDLRLQPLISDTAITDTICSGQTYLLPSGVTIHTTGIYHDTLHYNSGCDSIRTSVNLFVVPVELRDESASICLGETYTLPWGTIVNSAGNFADTSTTINGCDSLIRKVKITMKDSAPITINKSNDIDCNVRSTNLTASGAVDYLWSPSSTLSNPNSPNTIATPIATTTYYVLATALNGCTIKDSIEVKVSFDNVQNGFPVPSSFSPNSDGLNDCFGVKYWGNVTDFKFYIYNRWGQMIFYSSNPNECWDGTFKRKKQIPGTYVYQIFGNTPCGRIFRKGHVVLLW